LKIDTSTRVCAVIGNPVAHSLSPAIHNTAFQEAGLNICYTAFRVEDLPGAIAGFRALNFLGVSVTIPHKVAILPLLDQVEETARRIGSVNTVVNRDGRLVGYNTDGTGALRALRAAGISVQGKTIAIVGSGGAARAIAFSLGMEERPGRIVLFGIDARECEVLHVDLSRALAVPVDAIPLTRENLREHVRGADGIIHCTPVGMSPRTGESLLGRDDLDRGMFVFDIVYNPLRTRLLVEAEAAGCRIVPGLEMFLRQAMAQFEMWTGREAPEACMRKVLREALR
jgi:shikimate dehydrogenase